ncbi:amidase [Kribbella sp. NPDC050820]|uniref:amidase n=1 Tax=Kribbella sp. NPDC050820 TaxID=3155408 RepID=UPI0033E2F9A6
MSEIDLTQLSALELAAAIRAREISPVEVMEATLSQVDAVNDKVNTVIWRNDDEALAWAKAATDAITRVDRGELPPFHGVPIPIKDDCPVAGWPVTLGSWTTPDTPSAESELVIEALQRAGFVLTGRTNTPEFSYLGAAENDRYGITRNPWNLDRTPGGSSGGAAAAVAARMFAVAQASDGGGSMRVPASCCGLVALKASRGRVPARVIRGVGTSLNGVLTRDVSDTAAILDVISGPDRGAWYNAPTPERPFVSEVGADPGRLRIGLVDAAPLGLPIDPECAEAVREAAAALEDIGHHVEHTQFPESEEFIAAHLNLMKAGLFGDDVDWERAEPHIRHVRSVAQAIDAETYLRSVYVLQRLSRNLVSRWGSEFDILLTPTMSIVPPRAGELSAAAHASQLGPDGLDAVLSCAVFTRKFNMTGQPAISVPTHMAADGVPIGVQLVAGPWEEALLIRLASQLEEVLPWSERRPPTCATN